MSAVAASERPAPMHIAYILRSFPRLSQTHILNEILALERHGHRISIFGMTPSREALVQREVADVRAVVRFLDRRRAGRRFAGMLDHVAVLATHPARYLRTLGYVARHADLTAGYTTTTRPAVFSQAVSLAALLDRDTRRGVPQVDHVHSHFAHDPTLIALLLHRLTGIPYTFTAHARDLYQIPASTLAARIERATAVVTICRANIDFMRAVAPDAPASKFRLVHTGIDVDAFRPLDGATSPSTPQIVVVSRLVLKKGVLDLVSALARVRDEGHAFRCVVYGEGPLRGEVAEAIDRYGLSATVELAGGITLAELREVLPRADVFALTPFVTADGDRDGIPSSILEAMACGIPVVSTPVGGIAEAVIHGETGLLAEPHDVEGIARQIAILVADPALRRRLGAKGREAIVRSWNGPAVAELLRSVFDETQGRRP